MMTALETVMLWVQSDGEPEPLALAAALADGDPAIDAWLEGEETRGIFFLPPAFRPIAPISGRRWLNLARAGYALFCDADPEWVLPGMGSESRADIESCFLQQGLNYEDWGVLARWLRQPDFFTDDEAARIALEYVKPSLIRRKFAPDDEAELVIVLARRGASSAAYELCANLVDDHPRMLETLQNGIPTEALGAVFGGREQLELVGRSEDETDSVLRLATLFLAPTGDPVLAGVCCELLALAPAWYDCGNHSVLVRALGDRLGAAAVPGLMAAYVHRDAEIPDCETADLVVTICQQHRDATLSAFDSTFPAWCQADSARVADFRRRFHGLALDREEGVAADDQSG